MKARQIHALKRFIDDLIAINDWGEFGKVFREIYPEELELKEEHAREHANFLQLSILKVDDSFIYKFYDKRDAFPLHIVRMPQKWSNIPESMFYSALKGEFLHIALATLKLEDFIQKHKN